MISVSSLVGLLLAITVNILANTLPINGVTTAGVSANYPNLFTPAGITFSIWGIIYFLLFIYVIFQLVIALRKEHRHAHIIEKTGYWFFFSCIFNAAWIWSWHHHYIGLSLVIMALLLLTLIVLYRRYSIGACEVSRKVKYMVFLPVSIYLAWICVATIANTTAFLVALDWNGAGLSAPFLTVLLMAAGLSLAFIFMIHRRDIAVPLVFTWAYLGIFIKRMDETGFSLELVSYASLVGIAVLATGIIFMLLNRKSFY